jgi:hypothetical protein
VNAVIDAITERILHALAIDGEVTPQALMLLLRQYAATGRDELSEALGPALARAVDRCLTDPPAAFEEADRPDWMMLFVEAAALSEDDRVRRAIEVLVSTLEQDVRGDRAVGSCCRSINASLMAANLDWLDFDLSTWVDHLERIIGAAYAPGEGLTRAIDPADRRAADLADYVAAAEALVTAFGATGRLPYSMLAEELMQFARHAWWVEARGGFWPEPDQSATVELFVANCRAARVFCRLARLHRDTDYRQAAIIAEQSDYALDAARTLESLSTGYREMGLHAAALYALATAETVGLRPEP